MKNCPQCGRTMDDELDYCPDCGRDVSDVTGSYNSYGDYDDSNYDDEFDDRNQPDDKRGRKKREKKKKDKGSDMQASDGYVQDSGYPQDDYGKKDPVTVGGWLLTFLINMIPIVNLVMPFVWAFGNSQPSKKNWARASLIMFVITFLLTFILVFAMGSMITAAINDAVGDAGSLLSIMDSGDDEGSGSLFGDDDEVGDLSVDDDPFGLLEGDIAGEDEGDGVELDLSGFADAPEASGGDDGVTLDPSTGGDNPSSASPNDSSPQMTPEPNTDNGQQGLTPENTPGSANSYQEVINALSQSPIYTMQALTPDVSVAFGSFMMLTDATGNSYACAAVKVKNTGAAPFTISDTLFINALQNGNALIGGAYAAIYEETEGASFYKTVQPGMEEIVYLGYPTIDTSSPVTITMETWDAESSIASQTFDMSLG